MFKRKEKDPHEDTLGNRWKMNNTIKITDELKATNP